MDAGLPTRKRRGKVQTGVVEGGRDPGRGRKEGRKTW